MHENRLTPLCSRTDSDRPIVDNCCRITVCNINSEFGFEAALVGQILGFQQIRFLLLLFLNRSFYLSEHPINEFISLLDGCIYCFFVCEYNTILNTTLFSIALMSYAIWLPVTVAVVPSRSALSTDSAFPFNCCLCLHSSICR